MLGSRIKAHRRVTSRARTPSCHEHQVRPRSMKHELSKSFIERVLAWTYSMGFPLGVAALLYLRMHFGYNWPFPASVGLMLLCLGLVLLLAEIFLPALIHGSSQVLRWQSIYSSIWTSLVGTWLYWRLWGDSVLAILIAVALPLWPLSHREVLRLKGR